MAPFSAQILCLFFGISQILGIREINERDNCLKEHNLNRAKHDDTPNLTWDDTLASGAQQWANRLANMGRLQHSSSRSYGENLYMAGGWGTPATCKSATSSWYAEIKKYDWKNPGYQRGVGHFTQMVWKSSTKLGVGIAFNERSKKTYIVARYSPAGNFLGRFSENVMRLRTGTGGTGTGGTGSGGTGNGGNGNGGNGNGGTGTNGNAFATKCLASVNTFRDLHKNTDQLQWDSSLAADAKAWAQHLARLGSLKHSSNRNYGENLYAAGGWGTAKTCEDADKSWYGEISNYNWRRPGYQPGTGHFTQMIWKSTTHYGVGIHFDSNSKKTYIVARYSPAGNFLGRFAENVLPLKSGGTGTGGGSACKDMYNNCRRYVRYCSSNKKIRTGCKKTCQLC